MQTVTMNWLKRLHLPGSGDSCLPSRERSGDSQKLTCKSRIVNLMYKFFTEPVPCACFFFAWFVVWALCTIRQDYRDHTNSADINHAPGGRFGNFGMWDCDRDVVLKDNRGLAGGSDYYGKLMDTHALGIASCALIGFLITLVIGHTSPAQRESTLCACIIFTEVLIYYCMVQQGSTMQICYAVSFQDAPKRLRIFYPLRTGFWMAMSPTILTLLGKTSKNSKRRTLRASFIGASVPVWNLLTILFYDHPAGYVVTTIFAVYSILLVIAFLRGCMVAAYRNSGRESRPWYILKILGPGVIALYSGLLLSNLLAKVQVIRKEDEAYIWPVLDVWAIAIFTQILVAADSAVADNQMQHLLKEVESERGSADASNNAKRQFMRYIFHELRVPLNAILLGLEDMDEVGADISDALESMEDVLDLSKPTRGPDASPHGSVVIADTTEDGYNTRHVSQAGEAVIDGAAGRVDTDEPEGLTSPAAGRSSTDNSPSGHGVPGRGKLIHEDSASLSSHTSHSTARVKINGHGEFVKASSRAGRDRALAAGKSRGGSSNADVSKLQHSHSVGSAGSHANRNSVSPDGGARRKSDDDAVGGARSTSPAAAAPRNLHNYESRTEIAGGNANTAHSSSRSATAAAEAATQLSDIAQASDGVAAEPSQAQPALPGSVASPATAAVAPAPSPSMRLGGFARSPSFFRGRSVNPTQTPMTTTGDSRTDSQSLVASGPASLVFGEGTMVIASSFGEGAARGLGARKPTMSTLPEVAKHHGEGLAGALISLGSSSSVLGSGPPLLAIQGSSGTANPALRASHTAVRTGLSSLRETIDLLMGNASNMGKLLDDFLSLEKIEEGKFEIEPVNFRLADMVREAARLFAAPLAQKKLTLNLEIRSSCPEIIRGDVHKLRQVLCNFISNAIKFSPQGAVITVRASAVAARQSALSLGGVATGDKAAQGSTRRGFDLSGASNSPSSGIITINGGQSSVIFATPSSPRMGPITEVQVASSPLVRAAQFVSTALSWRRRNQVFALPQQHDGAASSSPAPASVVVAVAPDHESSSAGTAPASVRDVDSKPGMDASKKSVSFMVGDSKRGSFTRELARDEAVALNNMNANSTAGGNSSTAASSAAGTGIVPAAQRTEPGTNTNRVLSRDNEADSLAVAAASATKEARIACIRIAVYDQGPGINADDQGKLFKPFNQIKAGAMQKGNGTGLGLSICKRIVELSGGRVGIHSKEGRGSMFYFEVPMAGPPIAAPQPALIPPTIPAATTALDARTHTSGLSGSNIATRENAGSRLFGKGRASLIGGLDIGGLLGSKIAGGVFRQAPPRDPSQGRSGSLFASTSSKSASAPTPTMTAPVPLLSLPPLSLADDTRGGDHKPQAAAGSAKSAAAEKSNVTHTGNPSLAINTSATTISSVAFHGRASSQTSNPTAFTSTPLNLANNAFSGSFMARSLSQPEALSPLSGNGSTKQLTAGGAAGAEHTELTLLAHAVVVDDVKSNRDFFGRMLQRRGVTTIHYAEDGLLAVKLRDTLPAAVLASIQCWFMDKEMPNCDGHCAATKLRARGITQPIIGVTGNALAEDRREFIAAGANAIITKPVRAPDLEGALAQVGLKLAPIAREKLRDRGVVSQASAASTEREQVPIEDGTTQFLDSQSASSHGRHARASSLP